MILEIKLKDPNECDSCPCLEQGIFCNLYREYRKEVTDWGKSIRPSKCKEENSP